MHDVNTSGGGSSAKPAPSSGRLLQLGGCVLLFHVAHSLLQEEVFHLPGFNHALLLTLLQTMCIAAFAGANYVREGCERRTPLKYFVALSLLALVASVATNEASLRLNYPTQVIFKSSKLLAVMALRSVMLQNRGGRLTAQDIGSAVAVVAGLCAFTFATHQSKKHGSTVTVSTALPAHGEDADATTAAAAAALAAAASSADFLVGVVAVVVAVAADALLYIVEEKYCFHTFGSSSGEIIVFLNGFAAINAGGALVLSGKLVSSAQYIAATGMLVPLVLAYSLCNFVGTTAILSVVNEFGSPSAIIVTNTRKVMTILGSFLVYPKPFTALHALGLALVTGGVYAHEMARKKKHAAKEDDGGAQTTTSAFGDASPTSPGPASPAGALLMTPAVVSTGASSNA